MTEAHGWDGGGLEQLRLTVAAQQLAINRLSDELRGLAEQTTDGLAIIRDRIGGPPGDVGRPAASAARFCWRDLPTDEATALLAELDAWVGWLTARYPLGEAVPACWAVHPEMVEELTAAYAAWHGAYLESFAAATAAAEWHDRWLPGLEHRLTHRWKARRCDAGHQARPAVGPAFQPDAADQDAHAGGVADDHR